MNSYPHMCRDGHVEIGHSDAKNEELCPLCHAMSALYQIEHDAGRSGPLDQVEALNKIAASAKRAIAKLKD